jgi:hypothetical protein
MCAMRQAIPAASPHMMHYLSCTKESALYVKLRAEEKAQGC